MPEFDAEGSYKMDMVSQRRMLSRERRSAVNHLELPEAVESTLMAHIDHSESERRSIISRACMILVLLQLVKTCTICSNFVLSWEIFIMCWIL